MKVFGKKVGKAIQIPSIIKALKHWAKRAWGIGKRKSLAISSADSTVEWSNFGLSIPMSRLDTGNVKMEIQRNTLMISRSKDHSRNGKKNYGACRPYVSFSFRRTFNLQRNVDPDSIHVTLKNSLMQVRFSKRETMYKRPFKLA